MSNFITYTPTKFFPGCSNQGGLRWSGQIARMGMYTTGLFQFDKLKGRPRLRPTSENDIKTDLREVGCDDEQ
jgi:hypothetical protein